MPEVPLSGWWLVIVGLGALLILVGHSSHYYHNRRFQQHMETLERLSAPPTDDEGISQEVAEFHEDRRIDLATRLMMAEPVGIFVLTLGIFLAFV